MKLMLDCVPCSPDFAYWGFTGQPKAEGLRYGIGCWKGQLELIAMAPLKVFLQEHLAAAVQRGEKYALIRKGGRVMLLDLKLTHLIGKGLVVTTQFKPHPKIYRSEPVGNYTQMGVDYIVYEEMPNDA